MKRVLMPSKAATDAGAQGIHILKDSRKILDRADALATSPQQSPLHNWKFAAAEESVESETFFDIATSNAFDRKDWKW
jgi:hypothetical protein